jgi:glycosyltransferase involved in cell wall biosynthesis
MTRKPRLLYLAWTTPSQRGGACLAMQRHFLLHDDFELFVASSTPFEHPHIPSLLIRRHPLLLRLSNTRFCRLIRQWEMIIEPYWILKQIEPVLEQFSPDALFTIPDNTLSWTAYLISQQTGLPLITHFQDWWPRGQFTLNLEKPYPIVRELLERRLYKMYQCSDLAFCISNGMKQKLGTHQNAPILYACPAPRDVNLCPNFQPPSLDRPLRLIYAGTIVNAYGRSVLSVAKALKGRKDIEFHVYGPPPDWTKEDLAWMESEGVYRGLIPYDELKFKLYESDVLLVVTSFEPQFRQMMETSFTSKFLEYSQFGKPIIIWGPDYCQSVQIAQTHHCGLPVISPNVSDVITALSSLQDSGQWLNYAHSAWKAANSIFDPEYIHSILKDSIYNLLNEDNS